MDCTACIPYVIINLSITYGFNFILNIVNGNMLLLLILIFILILISPIINHTYYQYKYDKEFEKLIIISKVTLKFLHRIALNNNNNVMKFKMLRICQQFYKIDLDSLLIYESDMKDRYLILKDLNIDALLLNCKIINNKISI